MNNIEHFRNIPLFSDLPDDSIKLLAQHAITRSFKKNSVIVNQGDETNSLYVILEGSVRVFVDDEQGKEIILNTMEAGESFGEMALLSDAPRSASVMATSPSKLAMISKQDFMSCLASNPTIPCKIIEVLIKRAQDLTDEVSSLALLDVYGRIARTLVKHAGERDGKLVTKPLTHQEIASMVGSSREMVSKILKDLRIGGYITIEGKEIIIEQPLPSGW
jgi:CRP/FNR family cyclic AMP-dependent transcriptional regulator